MNIYRILYVNPFRAVIVSYKHSIYLGKPRDVYV